MFSFPGLASEASKVERLPTIQKEAEFVRSLLPDHYDVEVFPGFLHCRSDTGIRVANVEDDEHWSYIIRAIRSHFGNRLSEIYHITCTYHKNFKIYISQ